MGLLQFVLDLERVELGFVVRELGEELQVEIILVKTLLVEAILLETLLLVAALLVETLLDLIIVHSLSIYLQILILILVESHLAQSDSLGFL